MQPLPEQTSRMRSSFRKMRAFRRPRPREVLLNSENSCSSNEPSISSSARCVVYASVSGLSIDCQHCHVTGSVMTTNRGIKTPGRHLISSSPKGCEPRIYCRGSARDLLLQRCRRRFLNARGHGGGEGKDWTCSVSQRSSLMADGRSRVPCRTRGRSVDFLCARRRRECGSRGMSLSPRRKCLQ